MSRMTFTHHVPASPQRTFELCSDFPNAVKRVSAIRRVEMLTEGPIGMGTRFRETRIMFKKEGSEVMEVVEFDRPNSYTLAAHSCGCDYRTTLRFLPEGDGTRIEFSFDARPVSLMAKIMSPLFGLMMGPMMKKCVMQDLEDIAKAAAEVKA